MCHEGRDGCERTPRGTKARSPRVWGEGYHTSEASGPDRGKRRFVWTDASLLHRPRSPLDFRNGRTSPDRLVVLDADGLWQVCWQRPRVSCGGISSVGDSGQRLLLPARTSTKATKTTPGRSDSFVPFSPNCPISIARSSILGIAIHIPHDPIRSNLALTARSSSSDSIAEVLPWTRPSLAAQHVPLSSLAEPCPPQRPNAEGGDGVG